MTLTEFREWKEMTLQQMSDLTGVSVSFLCEIENGKGRPSPDVAEKIEKASAGKVTRMELLYPVGR